MRKIDSVIILTFILLAIQFLNSNFKILKGSILDFGYFYNAGELVLKNENPYREIDGGLVRNPPPTLLLYTLFTVLPIEQSQFLWFSISFLSFLLGSWFLFKTIDFSGWRIWLVYLSLCLIFFPFRYNLGSIQLGNFLFLLISSAFYFLQNKSYQKTALSIATAISLKVTPGIFILTLLILKKFKTTSFTIFYLLLLNIFSSFIFGIDIFSKYFAVSQSYFDFTVADYHNQSLSGFLLQLANSQQVTLVFTLITIIALLFFVIYIALRFKLNDKNTNLVFWNISILLMLILPPFSWQHYYTLAIFPLISTFYITRNSKFSNKFLILLLVSYLLMSINIKNPQTFESSGIIGSLILNHVFLGALVLLIINVIFLRKLLKK